MSKEKIVNSRVSNEVDKINKELEDLRYEREQLLLLIELKKQGDLLEDEIKKALNDVIPPKKSILDDIKKLFGGL